MAFHLRKSIDGDSVVIGKDYPIDSTYQATAKLGDVVRLNASGNLVLAATGDATVLGVLIGTSFDGAGVNSKTGKVAISPDALYEAEYVGAGALTPGTQYGIDGASKMDTADTTTKIVSIVEVVNGKPYVAILSAARQLSI